MTDTRVLPFTAIHNFRDYGGYPAASGRTVKRGLLFRSGQHLDASSQDLAQVAALDLKYVIDLRGNGERASYPCPRPEGFGASVVFYDGETAALAPHVEAAQGALDAAGAHAKMERLYSQLPTRTPLLAVLRDYFSVLARGDGASLVHCLAGKDRTGMAVALLHHVLGVHRDDAMADFLMTNTAGNIDARIAAGGNAIREKWGTLGDDTIRVLMGVDERYLAAMYWSVEDQFGDLDTFLHTSLAVDAAKRDDLRLHLLTG